LNNTISTPLILDHQKSAFDKLLALARACFYTQRQTLPIRPRSNTLIIGPSGTGKTFLASAIAEKIGAPFLSMTVGEWILLGCTHRGAESTWPLIVRFLLTNRNSEGVVLFVDEVDKLCGHTSWETFLRTEIFKLLDLDVPEGICNSDNDRIGAEDLKAAREVLANRTLILGAGAFQEFWEKGSQSSIGFSQISSPPQQISLCDLTATLPRELTNRFRSDLIVLLPLTKSDYHRIVNETSAQVPVYLRANFLRLALERIESAIRCQQGCRFLEEVMMDTVIAERENIKTWRKTLGPLCSEDSTPVIQTGP